MYDELLKKIRHCATDPMHCLSCAEDKDGRCFARLMTQSADAIEELKKRVPKRPHGRLIDADALKDLYHYNTHDSDVDKAWTGNIRRSIDNAPTVIEAEEGE